MLTRIQECEQEIEQLKKVRSEIAKQGYASATIASAGGSRSYTRLDLSKITDAIVQLTKELQQLNSMLENDGTAGTPWKRVHVIYN